MSLDNGSDNTFLATALVALTTVSVAAFPERDLILFLTFCVILFTLVPAGLELAAADRVDRELDLEETRLEV